MVAERVTPERSICKTGPRKHTRAPGPLTRRSGRHQLNHTPKQIYNCDFPDCSRSFVRQDLCNRHKDRHTAKGSQLHRKDSMLGHAQASSPTADLGRPLSDHGLHSPEVLRPNFSGIKSRANPLQYQSPHEHNPTSYSPAINPSSGTYPGTDNLPGNFKRSNSDTVTQHETPSVTPSDRPRRQGSFGAANANSAGFSRPPLQSPAGPYGLVPSASGHADYHSSHPSPQSYVSQQNFPPFTLPPPGYSTTPTTATSTRESEPPYHTSLPTDFPSEGAHHAQSGPDMMLLDQMSIPNSMPVFGGGGGYNRSPFAIPEDFVAFLFNGQQLDTPSLMGQMGQQGYAKLVNSR